MNYSIKNNSVHALLLNMILLDIRNYSHLFFFSGTTTVLTMQDRIFTSFLRYMFLLFFSQLAPRIQVSSKLLAHHWSEYFSDKYKIPYNQSLSKMAAIYIRRGDK